MTINKNQQNTKTVRVEYFAILKERRGCSSESIETDAVTVRDLYSKLAKSHNFPMSTESIRVAINHEFRDWDDPVVDSNTIVFIPPVAGG